MEIIGTRLDGRVQNGCAGAAIFCAKPSSLNFKFLDRIYGRKNYEVRAVQKVDGVGVVVNTVKQIVILCGTKAVGDKSAAGCIASAIRLRSGYTSTQFPQDSNSGAGPG